MEAADGVAIQPKGKWKREACANKDQLERIFVKYGLDPSLIRKFGFERADSCITALHLLHVAGYILPHTLRQLTRDILTYHKVQDVVLQKYCDFYIKQGVPWFKSSYVLFGVFVCRSPKILYTNDKIAHAANWVNAGMCTGHSIASVLSRCCKVIVEAAVRVGAMAELVAVCFNDRIPLRAQNQWRAVINGSGKTARDMFNRQVDKQFPGLADYENMNPNITQESGDYVNLAVPNPNVSTEFSPNASLDTTIEQLPPPYTIDECDGGDEFDEEFGAEDEPDELMLNNLGDFYERLKMVSGDQINVLTMADIIREVSSQQHPSDGDATDAPMPRNAIQRFYFLLEKMIDDRTIENPLYNTKRLMLLQLSTHSKKVIDFCRNRLKESVKALDSAQLHQQLNTFFWDRYLRSPLKFRPYAVSTILVILCSQAKMNSADVVEKLCAMTADSVFTGTRVNEHCDAVLHDLLVNRSVTVDFTHAFKTVHTFEKFEFYQIILDGVFLNVSLPVPLIYFKFRDKEVLDAAVEELRRLPQMRCGRPLIYFAQRLHFALSILEMCHSMHLLRLGPGTDDLVDFVKNNTSDVIRALLGVWSICPLLSFRERISAIASSLL